MNTKIILSSLFSLMITVVTSQECEGFSMLSDNAKWEMKSYDKKGKLAAVVDYHILKNYVVNDENMWDIKMNLKDEKEEHLDEIEYSMSCKEGVFKMSSVSSMNMAAFQNMEGMDMEINASEMEYPMSLSVDQKLPDSKTNLKFSMNNMVIMNMEILTKDRKVLSYEDITVPAGTYKAYKITQTSEVKSGFVNSSSTSIQYFVLGFGIVKSEEYDKKGKLEGYSELTSFSAN